jgi:hypothetical protein
MGATFFKTDAWKSDFTASNHKVNYRPLGGRLGFFPTLSGRKTKARQCDKVAVETGCKAPGLKQPIKTCLSGLENALSEC